MHRLIYRNSGFEGALMLEDQRRDRKGNEKEEKKGGKKFSPITIGNKKFLKSSSIRSLL